MADEPGGAAAPADETNKAGAQAPVPTSGASQAGADAGTLLGGGGDAGADAGADAGEGEGNEAESGSKWRDDWRETLAAGDAKHLAYLKRFGSPEAYEKSNKSLRAKFSSGQVKPTLPEGASEAEVAAYRKANGIPEKPDDYGLAFPEGVPASDNDKADLAAFQAKMHKENVPPGFVKAAFDHFVETQTQAAERRQEAAHEATIAAQAELRAEYGKDFKPNLTVADRFVAEHAGDKGPAIMQMRLADGTALGNNPDFVRFVVNAGLATAEDGALVTTAGGGASTMLDRYKSLMAKQISAPAEYRSGPIQAELADLATKMERKGINFAL